MKLTAIQSTKQSLTITAQIIQSIRLLQFSQGELNNYLNEQAERNPLLEVAQNEVESAGRTITPSQGTAAKQETAAPRPEGGSFSATRRTGGLSGEAANLEDYIPQTLNLRDHLIGQAVIGFRDPVERLIAQELIELVESDGYIRSNLMQLAHRLSVDMAKIEQVLRRIQAFEPLGVGARNLAECLEIQLREQGKLDAPSSILLQNLALLASCDYRKLSSLCAVPIERVLSIAKLIKTLDPRPGNRYNHSALQPALPDILLHRDDSGNWHVELNSATLPRVLVNRQYCAKIPSRKLGQDDRRFIMDCLKNANWLVRNMDQRAQTILRVASAIVQRQQEFLEKGAEYLRPMALRDIAQAVGMHESTICRAVSNKYMMTNRGMFELRYFFSNSIAATEGNAELSPESVRHRIQAMIAAETPDAILSDDALVAELRKSGIEIARRTVAKYREMMNIPSSQQRRRISSVKDLVVA